MNFAHLHVVLNHVPSIGSVVGAALFIASLVRKSDLLKKISLAVLVVVALAALPTYLSGNAAQLILRNRSEIPKGVIEAHQNSAMLTLIFLTITGALSWFGLWQFRRFSRPGSWNSSAVLIFSIATSVLILRTANIGGDISHPEIRVDQGTTIAENIGWRYPIERFSNDQAWVWPASETLHFVGMALLFGVTLLLTLRMLGMMKSIPFAAVHRLLPLGMLGFVINVISGMVFFIASPGMYISNPGFTAKIVFILLAASCVIYFTIFEGPWRVGADKEAPLSAKIVAVSTMVSLLGVMYFGRMLPFFR
ncbi:MAG TPA: hypothetical protein VE422_03335 [Terriglobia bacterium]|nr:hypothetical protein [Terriglobia bacterium]